MRRIGWFLALALFLPQTSSAIQLRWSDGSTDLTFASATRCTLIASAEPGESSLPAGWRLAWVAEGCSIDPLPVGTPGQGGQPAAVCELAPPTSPADVDANQSTAYFCTGGTSPEIAQIVLDLPADSRGKLQVVALDPADPDSSRVLRSGEVRFNGGFDLPFAPLVLLARKSHESLTYSVRVAGAGLDGVDGLTLRAPDHSWTQELTILTQSDSSMLGTANLAALVPENILSLSTSSAAMAAVSLNGDLDPTPLEPTGCASSFHETYLQDLEFNPPLVYVIQPKDFSIVRGFVDQGTNRYAMHVYYTRQNEIQRINMQPQTADRSLGHSVLTDWNVGWALPDTVAFVAGAGPGDFDDTRIWAPHIFLRDLTYHMFYTGVDIDGHQRIGHATTQDLVNWNRETEPVFDVTIPPWTDKHPPQAYGGQQCRDPFVIPDPSVPNRWYMYYSTLDSAGVLVGDPVPIIGVARSDGDFLTWVDQTALPSTRDATFLGSTGLVESPHVVRRDATWWLFYSVNGTHVFFEQTDNNMLDPDPDHWSSPVFIRDAVEGVAEEQQYWHASEYFRVNQYDYLAAFNDFDYSIQVQQIYPATPPYSFALGCPQVAEVGDRTANDPVNLRACNVGRGGAPITLRLSLPQAMDVDLSVFDVLGRRRRVMADGTLPAGETILTWNWLDHDGSSLSDGVYFVRLRTRDVTRVQKVVAFR
jgi:hypothetical protein